MAAASLASYVIGKLKSDEAATGDMSGRGRGSPTPRLTTVWRAKSIPYDIPDTGNSFRNEGSLLRLLRTKSMPLLGREGSTPPRRLTLPPHSRSPARSQSPSPVRRPTSSAVNRRKTTSGHLSDASESTVCSVTTPPPTPRSPSPSGPRMRSASDGHLWQRRKKQLRRATDKAAVMLPSVKNLRGKYDEKPADDEQPSAESGQVDGDPLQEDSEEDAGQERRRVGRHYSFVRRDVKSPERRQPPKPAVTPANVRKLLEKFEVSPQDEDEAGEVFSRSESQDRSKDTHEDQTSRRTFPESRKRTKNHRRSKSEPDPSAVLRHHAQTSPSSVKKLKMMFEREAQAESGRDFRRGATPERPIPLDRQKEATFEPPQARMARGKAVKETVTVDSSAADTLHLGVVDTTGPRQQGKTPPMLEVDHVLAAGTPSVRSLRQRFEEGASVQSLAKTAEEEAAPRPRRAIFHHLKTPFENPERKKSRSVSPEKETRKSLTSFSSASVKNLLRQFEALSPEETLQAAQDGLGHDLRSPRSPPPTDSQKRHQTSPFDHATREVQQDAESTDKVTLEVEVDSERRLRRQSRTSSSESSSGDEWREKESRRRRKEMEQERKRKEEEEAKERQRIEQEEKMLREKTEMEKIAKEKEKERITKEKEKERREKQRAEQEREAKEKEEEERRVKEILVKEAKEKLEEEREIREREQERLEKKEEEKRKERELLEQKQIENEKAELEIKKEREEKEKKEREEERKKRERAKHEKEMEEAEAERREREKVESEKEQEKEKRKNREREETERLQNEQKEEERRDREELIRLSGEEMPKGVGREDVQENDVNKPDKSNDRKVHEMIDRFKHLGQPGDALQTDTNSPPQGEASSEQRVERLIGQFTNLRDADLEGEARKGDSHLNEDEDGEDRRYSDVAALVNKFRKLNERRKSSSSSESENEGGKSREKPVKEEAPIPTIPARSNCPGKVRTLREDEMRFFESAACGGGGGGTEPFMRTQSLRGKKTEQSNFTQPRFGSLRGAKSHVAVLSTSSTTTTALPRNCRRLNTDELQFFTGEVTNIYRSRTAKPRGRAGKTGRGDGRPPKVPRDKALPDTEEFFRIAGQGDHEGEPNRRPAPSEDDSDSEPSVLRSNDDGITDSEEDIYEMDINLRSDADTENLSDTEHHCDLNHPLSLLVHSIQEELLQPVASEGCKEAESRCYVVFSPEGYLCSSEDEDEALQFTFPSNTLKENVSTTALKENEIYHAVHAHTWHDAPGNAVVLNVSTENSKAGRGSHEHTESEDHTSQLVVFPYSSEEDAKSSQIIDSSQHDDLTKTENGAGIDLLGQTKVDSRPLEGLKGFVLTDQETGKTGETGSREDGQPLLTHEERASSDKEEVEKEEEVNIKKVNLPERAPSGSPFQEEQHAIAALVDELDRLDPLPPTTAPPPTTRRRENPYRRMNSDDSSSETSSEDAQAPTELSVEDVKSIEEQIIPLASFQGLLASPEGPSGTPSGDDGPPGTAKDLKDTGSPSQDPITPLGTTEDLFIAAPPSRTQESVPINSFNDALKEEEEEEEEEEEMVENENHISSLISQHPERQEEEEKTEIRGDTTVLEEEPEQSTSPPPQEEEEEEEEEEEDKDIVTGREFIKFCIFSLWFSLVMYFLSDILQ